MLRTPGGAEVVISARDFEQYASVAYAIQARKWLTIALQQEVDDGLMTEAQAIAYATRIMRTNQQDCFDLEGTRANIHTALDAAAPALA